MAFSASNPTKDQLYPAPTLQIKVFKNSSHFSINWYLPIIVDESRAERVQVQYDGQSTASDTDVIHAARWAQETGEERKETSNLLVPVLIQI